MTLRLESCADNLDQVRRLLAVDFTEIPREFGAWAERGFFDVRLDRLVEDAEGFRGLDAFLERNPRARELTIRRFDAGMGRLADLFRAGDRHAGNGNNGVGEPPGSDGGREDPKSAVEADDGQAKRFKERVERWERDGWEVPSLRNYLQGTGDISRPTADHIFNVCQRHVSDLERVVKQGIRRLVGFHRDRVSQKSSASLLFLRTGHHARRHLPYFLLAVLLVVLAWLVLKPVDPLADIEEGVARWQAQESTLWPDDTLCQLARRFAGTDLFERVFRVAASRMQARLATRLLSEEALRGWQEHPPSFDRWRSDLLRGQAWVAAAREQHGSGWQPDPSRRENEQAHAFYGAIDRLALALTEVEGAQPGQTLGGTRERSARLWSQAAEELVENHLAMQMLGGLLAVWCYDTALEPGPADAAPTALFPSGRPGFATDLGEAVQALLACQACLLELAREPARSDVERSEAAVPLTPPHWPQPFAQGLWVSSWALLPLVDRQTDRLRCMDFENEPERGLLMLEELLVRFLDRHDSGHLPQQAFETIRIMLRETWNELLERRLESLPRAWSAGPQDLVDGRLLVESLTAWSRLYERACRTSRSFDAGAAEALWHRAWTAKSNELIPLGLPARKIALEEIERVLLDFSEGAGPAELLALVTRTLTEADLEDRIISLTGGERSVTSYDQAFHAALQWIGAGSDSAEVQRRAAGLWERCESWAQRRTGTLASGELTGLQVMIFETLTESVPPEEEHAAAMRTVAGWRRQLQGHLPTIPPDRWQAYLNYRASRDEAYRSRSRARQVFAASWARKDSFGRYAPRLRRELVLSEIDRALQAYDGNDVRGALESLELAERWIGEVAALTRPDGALQAGRDDELFYAVAGQLLRAAAVLALVDPELEPDWGFGNGAPGATKVPLWIFFYDPKLHVDAGEPGAFVDPQRLSSAFELVTNSLLSGSLDRFGLELDGKLKDHVDALIRFVEAVKSPQGSLALPSSALSSIPQLDLFGDSPPGFLHFLVHWVAWRKAVHDLRFLPDSEAGKIADAGARLEKIRTDVAGLIEGLALDPNPFVWGQLAVLHDLCVLDQQADSLRLEEDLQVLGPEGLSRFSYLDPIGLMTILARLPERLSGEQLYYRSRIEALVRDRYLSGLAPYFVKSSHDRFVAGDSGPQER